MERFKKVIVITVITVILGMGASALILASMYEFLFGGTTESSTETIDTNELGLPPWVTKEILVTSLELQEQYGIYASVTIAQAQQEVGGT